MNKSILTVGIYTKYCQIASVFVINNILQQSTNEPEESLIIKCGTGGARKFREIFWETVYDDWYVAEYIELLCMVYLGLI